MCYFNLLLLVFDGMVVQNSVYNEKEVQMFLLNK